MASTRFLAVRTVVNGEDPMGLLAIGAPVDEYDPEVADLARQRPPIHAQQVREVFEHYFGDDGDIGIEAAERIATGVNRHQP